jgi:hypothetical protein
MSLLDFFLGLPRWAKELPTHVRPSSDQIRRLETIRTNYGVSDQDFLMYIAGHSETTRRVQKFFYNQLKNQMPNASEREVLKQLLLSRLTTALGQGSDIFGIASLEDESAFDAQIDQVISQHTNLESLIDAMIEYEKHQEYQLPASPGMEDAIRKVDEILAES